MILATIKGKVTNVDALTTKDKKTYYVVTLLQLNDKGKGGTIDVKIWDAKKASEYRKDAVVGIDTAMDINLYNGKPQVNFNVF